MASRAFYSGAAALFAQAGAPYGQVLAALGFGDLEQAAGNASAAVAAYAEAAIFAAAIENPVAEANRMLGLPSVNTISLPPAGFFDDYNDAVEVDLLLMEEAEANRIANLAQFPNHNIEGYTLVAGTEARLSTATAFAQGQN